MCDHITMSGASQLFIQRQLHPTAFVSWSSHFMKSRAKLLLIARKYTIGALICMTKATEGYHENKYVTLSAIVIALSMCLPCKEVLL